MIARYKAGPVCNHFYQHHEREKRSLGRLVRGGCDYTYIPYEQACYPAREVAVFRRAEEADILEQMRWGYVAPFANEIDKRRHWNNARSDKLLQPGRYPLKSELKAHRCIIPGSYFVEWSGVKGSKITHRFARADGEALLFAGLWGVNNQVAPEPISSCTMITTEANGFMSAVHDRMPVILSVDEALEWLDAEEPPLHLLGPSGEEILAELTS